MNQKKISQALGWFSIGLGLAEILMPRRLSKGIGVHKDNDMLLKMLGAREIASGIGLLAQPKHSAWAWSRVAGDAMDLALLGTALTGNKNEMAKLAGAIAAVAGVTAVDIMQSVQLTKNKEHRNGEMEKGRNVREAITIQRSPEEVYKFWRNFENLPKFMVHLQSVKQMEDPRRSHWVAEGPGGKSFEWDSLLVEDHPNELISWRSVPPSEIEHSGSVRFEKAPGNRGTIVRVEMSYEPPAGMMGVAIAKLMGREPQQQVEDDLRHLKQFLETGELSTIKGQTAGRAHSTSKKFDRVMPEPQDRSPVTAVN
ncbi:MAG: SRPBCC family protein [Verrucomicrobiales bacterium]